VQACHLQPELHAALGRRERDIAAEIRQRVAAADRRRLFDSEIADLLRPHQGAPVRGVGIVGIDHRRALRRQRGEYRAVLARDLLHSPHEFLVLALGVVDQRHRRVRNTG
jgi:hypothetical protein